MPQLAEWWPAKVAARARKTPEQAGFVAASTLVYASALSTQPPSPRDDLVRILWTADEIALRIRELAASLCEDLNGVDEPLIVGVLTGSVFFVADLVRAMDRPVQLDFIAVSSYGEKSQSSGVVRLLKDLGRDISGKHVVLVEDIVDTGLTLAYLRESLLSRHPASLRICTLLDKAASRKVEVPVDYVGFDCPDAFVVGYGLDYAGRYRNLPDIGELAPEYYGESKPD